MPKFNSKTLWIILWRYIYPNPNPNYNPSRKPKKLAFQTTIDDGYFWMDPARKITTKHDKILDTYSEKEELKTTMLRHY